MESSILQRLAACLADAAQQACSGAQQSAIGQLLHSPGVTCEQRPPAARSALFCSMAHLPRPQRARQRLQAVLDLAQQQQAGPTGNERILVSEVRFGSGTAAAGWSRAARLPPSYLACQVEIKGVDGELRKLAEDAITIRPNFAYTAKEVRHLLSNAAASAWPAPAVLFSLRLRWALTQVEDNVRHVFQSGFFEQLTPRAEDTRDGVKLTLEVPALLQPAAFCTWCQTAALRAAAHQACLPMFSVTCQGVRVAAAARDSAWQARR